MRQKEHGNIVVYLLIAVVLLGGLTFTMSRSNQGENTGSQLSQAQMETHINQLLNYASSADIVINEMLETVSPFQISFIEPSDGSFESEPPTNMKKVFHPSGGGLNYMQIPKEIIDTSGGGAHQPGYYIRRSKIEWSPSSADDITFTAYRISKEACEAINKKLIGSTDIPVGPNTLSNQLINKTYTLKSTDCADCVGKNAICISNNAQTNWAFYKVLVSR